MLDPTSSPPETVEGLRRFFSAWYSLILQVGVLWRCRLLEEMNPRIAATTAGEPAAPGMSQALLASMVIANQHAAWGCPLHMTDELLDAWTAPADGCDECVVCGYRHPPGNPRCLLCGGATGAPGIFEAVRKRLAKAAGSN
jgi:hypothetical protein